MDPLAELSKRTAALVRIAPPPKYIHLLKLRRFWGAFVLVFASEKGCAGEEGSA